MRSITTVLALTVFAAARAHAQQPDSQPKPTQPTTIAGYWTYNEQQSTDPRRMTQFGDSGDRPGGRGGYGGGGGRGGFGGGRGGLGGAAAASAAAAVKRGAGASGAAA